MQNLALTRGSPVIRIGMSALTEAQSDFHARVEYLGDELRNGHRLEIYSGGIGPQGRLFATFESAEAFHRWLKSRSGPQQRGVDRRALR